MRYTSLLLSHFRWRSCISRPTRLMTWGEMFSNDERSDIFLLLMAGAEPYCSPAEPNPSSLRLTAAFFAIVFAKILAVQFPAGRVFLSRRLLPRNKIIRTTPRARVDCAQVTPILRLVSCGGARWEGGSFLRPAPFSFVAPLFNTILLNPRARRRQALPPAPP